MNKKGIIYLSVMVIFLITEIVLMFAGYETIGKIFLGAYCVMGIFVLPAINFFLKKEYFEIESIPVEKKLSPRKAAKKAEVEILAIMVRENLKEKYCNGKPAYYTDDGTPVYFQMDKDGFIASYYGNNPRTL